MNRSSSPIVAALLIAACMSSVCFAQKASIQVGNKKRDYIVYRPKGLSGAARTMLCLHGGSGTADITSKNAPLRKAADKHKWLLIFPQGVNNTWNSSIHPYDTPGATSDAEDVRFLQELIDSLVAKGMTKRGSVAMMGWSRGGLMTARFATEKTTSIAAMGMIIANHPYENPQRPETGLPAMFVQGTADPLMPFVGGTVPGKRDKKLKVGTISASDTVAIWVKANGSNQPPKIQNIDNNSKDKTRLEIRDYTDGQNPVKHVVVHGGGHTTPDSTNKFQVGVKFGVVGMMSREMETFEEMLTFFGSKVK